VGQSETIVRGVYEAFGKGDVPSVLGAFAAAIEWNEAEGFAYADGNPYRGPQAVAAGVFMRIVGDVDGFTVSPQRYIEAGDVVVVEGRYSGTMKATGTRIDSQFAHIWQTQNGKIIRFQQYTDTRQWAEAARA
jgi:ketosteroid isomerase-like protein